MQLSKANRTKEVVLAAMTLGICQFHLTIAAVDDQKSLCIAQLCKSLLEDSSLNEIKCFSEEPYLNLSVELKLKLF